MAEDYANVFEGLFEGGMVSRELSDKLKDMARLSKLLIHLCGEIDHGGIIPTMGERIQALEGFMGASTRES